MRKITSAFAIGISLLYFFDLHSDRSHTIRFKKPVPIYEKDLGLNNSTVIGEVKPEDGAVVERIIYEKDHMAIKVRTKDQRSGWVFFDENITLSK